MITSCEAGAALHDQNGPVHDFQPNAFMLVINPLNPDDAHIVVADFGADVTKAHNPASAFEQNLSRAATFYAWMTGEAFQLPEGYPSADRLNADYSARAPEILGYRGYV